MDSILYECKNNVAYITFNRPDRYNALNLKMLEDLLAVVEKVEKGEEKVVILAGAGNAFCAGGDVGMMKDFADRTFFNSVMDTIAKIVRKLYLMPKVIISAIHGSAAGLGLSLALTADYVIAHHEAKLGMLFIGIGLAPDGGGHFWLEQRLGVHRAKQFTWGMQQAKAPEAQAMGLVDIVTEENVLDYASKQANRILVSPIVSILKTKAIYHNNQIGTLDYYLQAEKDVQWELRNTIDHKEGVKAFLEKRKPMFKGK